MFQSIKYIKSLDYNKKTDCWAYKFEKTDCWAYKFELTDSDFGCVGVEVAVEVEVGVGVDVAAKVEVEVEVGAIIKEYTKRNLNVAYNLLLCFRWYEKQYDYPIADQIEWAEKYQPLFTPQIKADIEKYLTLI